LELFITCGSEGSGEHHTQAPWAPLALLAHLSTAAMRCWGLQVFTTAGPSTTTARPVLMEGRNKHTHSREEPLEGADQRRLLASTSLHLVLLSY
jgi:hypothetical protein